MANEDILAPDEAEQAEGKAKKRLLFKKEKTPKEEKPKKEKAPKEKKPKKEKPPKGEKAKKEKPPKKEKAKKPPKAKAPKKPKPAKKAKPPKKAKAEKKQPAKEEPNAEQADNQERRGQKSLMPSIRVLLTLIPLTLILLVVLFLSASVYFDLFNMRTGMIDILSSLDSEHHEFIDTLKKQEKDLNQRQDELTKAEKAWDAEKEMRLKELQEQLQALQYQQEEKQAQLEQEAEDITAEMLRLKKRADALDEREKKLSQREKDATPIYRGELSDEKLGELKNLGKIYSGMSAEAAADILPQLFRPADMAAVIFYMDKTAAAALMEALPSEISAQITTEMLRE